jgi:hypothetical protein
VQVTDFSGHNWDEMVVDSVIESSHDDEFDTTPRMRTIFPGSGHSSPSPQRSRTSEAERSIGQRPPSRVDLSHADLQGADLRNANLNGANLSRANLRSARLDHANLNGADLRGADLRSASLPAAKLHDTHLYGAIFDQTTDLPLDKEQALHRGMVFLDIED